MLLLPGRVVEWSVQRRESRQRDCERLAARCNTAVANQSQFLGPPTSGMRGSFFLVTRAAAGGSAGGNREIVEIAR